MSNYLQEQQEKENNTHLYSQDGVPISVVEILPSLFNSLSLLNQIPAFFLCHTQKVFLQKPPGMQSSMSFKFSKVLIITSISPDISVGIMSSVVLGRLKCDHKGFFPECLSVSFMMSFMSRYFHVVRIFFIHLNRVLKQYSNFISERLGQFYKFQFNLYFNFT